MCDVILLIQERPFNAVQTLKVMNKENGANHATVVP